MPDPSSTLVARPPRTAFAYREFNLGQGARLFSDLGAQVRSVAVGWQVYAATERPIDLAWVALAQFLPSACLTLVAGHVADRVERRKILALCHGATAILSLALFAVALHAGEHLWLVYLTLAGFGAVRAFTEPAEQSLLPLLVPAETFPNALAWQSTLWQGATMAGPMLGGLLYTMGAGPGPVYLLAASCAFGAFVLVALMRRMRPPPPREEATLRSMLAGVRYIRGSPVLLGSISLDLFAVLLGGATALLPVFARDVLRLGPWALGAMRSAPAIGAAAVGVALALRPVERRSGARMLAGVAVFGAATVLFGLSRNLMLSLAALVLIGAADMLSVIVRSSLVQCAVPDSLRGRVSAVNLLFIGASSELGQLESGATAQWLGAVPSAVIGGVGSLVVAAIWAWRFPALLALDRVEAADPEDRVESRVNTAST